MVTDRRTYHKATRANVVASRSQKWDPIPRAMRDAVAQRRLKPIDLLVTGVLLEHRRVRHSTWRSNQRIAQDVGKTVRTVQASLGRLRDQGFVRRVRVAIPDPDDPGNETGYRFLLLWLVDTSNSPIEVSQISPREVKFKSPKARAQKNKTQEPPCPPTGEPAAAEPTRTVPDEASPAIEALAAEAERLLPGTGLAHDIRRAPQRVVECCGGRLECAEAALRRLAQKSRSGLKITSYHGLLLTITSSNAKLQREGKPIEDAPAERPAVQRYQVPPKPPGMAPDERPAGEAVGDILARFKRAVS